tara:strand:- start:613 stop:861 length:249 start_codon:yes stop_codon:yes gene_type:complete
MIAELVVGIGVFGLISAYIIYSQSHENDEVDTNECAICLEDIHPDDEDVTYLSCCHMYHNVCISQWFKKGRRVCPLCGIKQQ